MAWCFRVFLSMALTIGASQNIEAKTADVLTVKVNAGVSVKDTRYHFFIELLDQVLKATRSSFGPYRIKRIYQDSQQKVAASLESGKLNVAILTNGKAEADRQLMYVPYPLMMGLLGYRVLLIREADQDQFSKVTSIEGLKNFRGGYNRRWADYSVLTTNGLKLVTRTKYELMLQLLQKGKADYLSRSILEVEAELKKHFQSEPKVKIDSHLLLHYNFANFFYVKAEDQLLYHRLTTGFEAIIASGKWLKLIEAHYGKGFRQMRFEDRQLIRLENPDMKDHFVENLKFWVDHKRLQKLAKGQL
ncbi:MAG: hypothetical protein CL675_10185 [Bdellovibrionaceae bacterium]|nr:hypothetical protein [Pseudobdellovibrionaceae bacterium]